MKLTRAKISTYEIKKIIKCFCLDINVSNGSIAKHESQHDQPLVYGIS